MKHFIANLNGHEKMIDFSPKIVSLPALQNEIQSIFGIPIEKSRLSYLDLENDEIEIIDKLDFEYFLSLAKEQLIEIKVISDFKQSEAQEEISTNPFKKAKDIQNQFIEETTDLQIVKHLSPSFINLNDIQKNTNYLQANDDTLLDALHAESDRKSEETNLKTINQCLSESEILTQLKEKVEAMTLQMAQSLMEIKKEVVNAKRKNSGIISREINSNYVHLKTCCSNCGLTPIHGKRYKCISCKQYELCEICEENNFHSHHPMIRLVESVRSSAYYDELAVLIKLALGNLKTTDECLKKKVLKSVFGDHINSDAIDIILNTRSKKTVEEVISEFHKLLQ